MITEKEIAQNLLMAYINIEAAKKSMLVLWEFRDKIHNKDFIEQFLSSFHSQIPHLTVFVC